MAGELAQICKMLEGDDMELRCAAAKVLGALKAKGAPAVKALKAALADENEILRTYALDALATTGSKEAVPAILPFLGGVGSIRAKAVDALASFGRGIVSEVKKGLLGEELPARQAAAEVLAKIGGKSAMSALLDALLKEELELSKQICLSVKLALPEMPEKEKKELYDQVQEFLGRDKVKKRAMPTVSGLKLLGYLGDAKAKTTLLQFAKKDGPPPVRANALVALRSLDYGDSGNETLVKELLELLTERDFMNIVANALPVLHRLPCPAKFAKTLLELTDSPHRDVRAFAMSRLAEVDKKEVAEKLIGLLEHNDPDTREAAVKSLGSVRSCVTPLVGKLEKAPDLEQAMTIAKILARHQEAMTKTVIDKCGRTLAKLVDGDQSTQQAYAFLLRRIAPETLQKTAIDKAKALKKKKDYDAALKYLRLVSGTELFSDDAKYEMAGVRLKQSRKDLSELHRRSDPALSLWSGLIASESFPLVKRLKADSAVFAPEDYFYLGFHFSERLDKERRFGGEMLKYVIQKHPRKQIGKDAKNKLKLEGADKA